MTRITCARAMGSMETVRSLCLGALVLTLLAGQEPLPAQEAFLRGDANQDGTVSFSDMIYVRRWLFSNYGVGGLLEAPPCLEAVDVNDDGRVDICDIVGIWQEAVLSPDWDPLMPPPFPEVGQDPPEPAPVGLYRCGPPNNADPSPLHLGCGSYQVVPAQVTGDVVRLGIVEAVPGEDAAIPIYLTASVAVDALQLVIEYDPELLRVASGHDNLTYEGSYYEDHFFGQVFEIPREPPNSPDSYRYPEKPLVSDVAAHEDLGILVITIAGDLLFRGFEIEPGEDVLVAHIHGTVSGDAPQGTISLSPPPAGVGPYGLRNELTHRGEARYVSVVPSLESGALRIGIVGDVTFFRGDSNSDGELDISDPVSILSALFLGTASPRCEDAADADDSGTIEITDAIRVLDFLFTGSSALPAPSAEPGKDPTPDFLKPCRS